jgi:hypothetical protein
LISSNASRQWLRIRLASLHLSIIFMRSTKPSQTNRAVWSNLPEIVAEKVRVFQNRSYAAEICKRNIEMTPLCKIEVTHPRVLGSREVRRGGVVDEQAGVQPS